MAPIAPMWWFKEVPVQLEAFVDRQQSTAHVVPFPRNIQPFEFDGKKAFANQGGVFASPNEYAKSVVWRTKENATVLELISISGKENTPTRMISFRFHAPILPGVHVAPLSPSGGICIILLTADCTLYRLQLASLSRFVSKDIDEGYSSAVHIKCGGHLRPLSFKYIQDRIGAVASAEGTLHLIKSSLLAEDTSRHEHAEASVFDLHDDSHLINRIQHVSTIQKLYTKFQSALETNLSVPAGFPDLKARMDIVAMESFVYSDDVLLFTLHQDRTIRIWSVIRRQFLQLMRAPAMANDSGFVQETIDNSCRSHLGIMFNPLMPWAVRVLAYIPTDSEAQLSVYSARLDSTQGLSFIPGSVSTFRPDTIAGSGVVKPDLVSMTIGLNPGQSGYTVWGLWEGHTRISAKYLQLDDPVVERTAYDQFASREILGGRWWAVAMQAPLSSYIKALSSIDDSVVDAPTYFKDFVFTSGRFSDRTILLALRALFPERPLSTEIDLEQHVRSALAHRKPAATSQTARDQIRQDEIMSWTRFIATCARIDHEASVPLALSIAPDTGYMIIVKQDSLSFLTACDDSEILFHTFHDQQFDSAQFLSTPPSQLRNTYPKLQSLSLRQDVAKIFMAMGVVTRNMDFRVSSALESVISQLSTANGPQNFVNVLSRQHLDRYISKTELYRSRNLLASCRDLNMASLYIVDQLLSNTDVGASGLLSKRCVLPYEAVVASSLQQLVEHRYSMAQNYLILVSIQSSASASLKGWVRDAVFISEAMRTVQSLYALKWIATQYVSSPSLTTTQGIERQLSQLQVQDGSKNDKRSSLYRQSLTGTLLKSLASEGGAKYGSVEFPIYLAIPRAASKFLYQLGFLSTGSIADAAKHHVGLAQQLCSLGELDLLSKYLETVPLTSTLAYYRGKVLLSQGQPAEALQYFLSVTACFGNDAKNAEELDILQRDFTGGAGLRGPVSLERYYEHLIQLLTEKEANDQVIAVAQLALSEHQNNATGSPLTEKQKRILLAHIFSSALSAGHYERAYNAMMQIPGDVARKQYLRVFLSTMCRAGDGAALGKLAFTGMQDEVERLLLVGAQQNPVLSYPDHYRILYSFYSFKGDYRNAATIMCQYARRLANSTSQTESAMTLLTETGACYLAAINALHLAGSHTAWVAIPAAEEDSERSKRRKLSTTSHGMPSGLSSVDQHSGVSCKLEIVSLADMKKEYALTKALLKLIREIPRDIMPAVPTMSAREAQIMLVRRGHYEDATSLGLMFNLDLDVVFDLLVDKYLAALNQEHQDLYGKAGLEGVEGVPAEQSLSASALLTLQDYLKRHDNADTSYKYRLEVMDRILTRNPSFNLQPWLTQHYVSHNPEDLIRLYLQHGALEKAARFSSSVIQSAVQKEEVVSKHPGGRWLPYSLLDEILESLKEDIKEIRGQLPTTNDGRKGIDLERKLSNFRNLKEQLEGDLQIYMENVQRESMF